MQPPIDILRPKIDNLRPKRGRPPANPTTGETPTSADTACTVVGAAESNVSATQTDCAKEDHDSVGTGSATTRAMASDDHVGTDADNQFKRTRPYLPRRCKGTKMMTSSVNPKSSSRSLEPMTSPEDLSSQTGKSTDASDGLPLRVSLPRACKKMIVADKSTATPSAIKSQEEEGVEEDEEEPGEEKNKKSPDDLFFIFLFFYPCLIPLFLAKGSPPPPPPPVPNGRTLYGASLRPFPSPFVT